VIRQIWVLLQNCAVFLDGFEFQRPSVSIPRLPFVLLLFVHHKRLNIINEADRLVNLSVKLWRTIPRNPLRLDVIRLLPRTLQNVYVVVEHVRDAAAKVVKSLEVWKRVAAYATEKCTEMNVEFSHIVWERSTHKVLVNLEREICFVAENYDFVPNEIVECELFWRPKLLLRK
jgi:hypothetical protein